MSGLFSGRDASGTSAPDQSAVERERSTRPARQPIPSTMCHRCDGDLPFQVGAGESSSLFCPHCGAPQLLLPAHLLPASPDPEAEQVAGHMSTGVAAPPRLHPASHPTHAGHPSPSGIDWRSALSLALLAALVSGVLLGVSTAIPALSLLVLLAVFGAPALVVSVYRRRTVSAVAGSRVGLRLGLVTGLLTLAAMALSLAIAGLAGRFGLHRMHGFDAALTASLQNAQQQSNAMLAGSPDGPEAARQMAALMGSPEGRVGMALFVLLFQSTLILLFSTLGGVLAGVAGDRPRTASRLL